jgi:Zn-dependent M28 family amino/carboxypeptidase
MTFFRCSLGILPLFLVACSAPHEVESTAANQAALQPALNSITSDGLLSTIKVLSSDEYEGRAPATPGEDKTTQYLTERFKSAGLQPGNPDGTYIQKVPLAGIRSKTDARITVHGKPLPLTPKADYVASSTRYVPQVKVANSDIVFVGYGVVAPEYGWDDYKDVDVKGKTILMLVNDPPVPDATDASKLDEKMFKGKAMTYYGRWTYKFEIAAQKGAAAAIIVHETVPAGYPFTVVNSSFGREDFTIRRPDNNMGSVGVQGWITFDKAAQLCAAAGQDLTALKQAAVGKNFRPVTLAGAKAAFDVHNELRSVDSKNVIAMLAGSDAKWNSEYIIYTAHWDHLGRDTSLKGDQIFHGAIDNASGTAALLELAKAYTKLSPSPKRSILFLSVTAEEKGLLGSRYYAENPLYPLNKTLANINIDGVNQWGKTKDLTVIGLGNSTLDDVAAVVAKEDGRVLRPDAEPEKGFFYRSDHFEFAKQGVPALDSEGGVDYIGKPEGYGMKKRDEYTNHDYHNVTDVVKPDWDLSGAVDDMRLLFQVGYQVAQTEKWPEWKAGTEFKAKREAMLK